MITAGSLHFTFSSRLHFPHSTTKRPHRYTKLSPPLTFLNRHSLLNSPNLNLRRNPNFKVIQAIDLDHGGMRIDDSAEGEDCELPVEMCYTHSLPPALTLEHGFIKIKEAVEMFKSNPPSTRSGIVRFQVPVPPSANALSWLCSQPQSLELFPQFYMSKENQNNPTLKSHSFSEVSGLSGFGAAVYLTGSSCASKGWALIQRYLSVDSPLIRAYGFVGIKFDMGLSSIKHENGSFYIYIPHIELGEYEGISLLAATLAWNDLSLCAFDKAVKSFELSLYQAMFHSSPSEEICANKRIYNILGKSNVIEDNNFQMVSVNANSFNGKDIIHSQLEETSASCQFCFRLSPNIALTRNMLDHPSEVSRSLQYSANINAVWASLIIEECFRLGLKYFCIAPGSRSAPLAVAASSHPCTTCISCFDERSLAFHAVGYARGSYRPAVVITSSGTAVSNLFPAVVEASQDFVPILLLTADRPPELQNAGASQAINQVNHFGSYVRFFFNLPPPTDHVPARMVLTTVDSAVYFATHDPCGPVHINCQFREPLEDTPREWMTSSLKGLEHWTMNAGPFSKYIRLHYSHACNIGEQLDEVIKLIQCASKGLLLIGAIHTEHEIWAALLLAKHLSWPTLADILSGLRIKKVLTTFPEFKEKLLFVDHLDHALLSDSVREWARADVIVQVGSRITSKRIGQMLEVCSPCSYIMVDKHPYRHDPSHIVTHRIQSSVTEFASSVLQLQFSRTSSKWTKFMQAINMMVAWEIQFQIHSEYSLTEPYIAQVISDALPRNAALFIGNSMVIRDADMYGRGWLTPQANVTTIMSSWELHCLGLRVSGNRGASGIDGLLSTAIGFSAGCNKQVFCVIGDVSFLHDTNALAILKQRAWRKPMTILVINNHGGAIFSLLPIAERTQQSILNRYFYTSHDISIGKLCEAHSVNHLKVGTKLELRCALSISQEAQADYIIEVESCIEDNANFHSILRQASCRTADHTLGFLSRLSVPDHTPGDLLMCKIDKAEYSMYRIQLSAPPTSVRVSGDGSNFYREGFVLAFYLEDGTVGFGEVAPLEMHAENLEYVEEQLRFLLHVIQGTKISYLLPLLRGSFSLWISGCLGIPAQSVFPSVRCGIEMAILNALAAQQGLSLTSLLVHRECPLSQSQLLEANETIKRSSVQICALLDSNGTPKEMADHAAKLVEEGFTTIKLKVGRRANPCEDAAVVKEIRKKVGPQIKLRADANQNWTFKQACQFGYSVKLCDLQYIEEPVNKEEDIIKFCEETGLPVALDESIDSIHGDPLVKLGKFIHQGIVAVVIKPSVVGGFENAALIAKWAQKKDKMAVISSAFESSLSLSTYIQFSYYLNQQNADMLRLKNQELKEPVAHGLGTYRWLKEDVTTESVRICGCPHNNRVETSVEDAAKLLQNLQIDPNIIQRSYTVEEIRKYQLAVDYEGFSYSVKVLEAGPLIDNHVLVFVHGFLGSGQDWIPIMKALSKSARCISIDLPGHGETSIHCHGDQGSCREPKMSVQVIANVLCKLICSITPSRVVLVGYSMGARIALYMALRCKDQINGAVVISGSPGLKDKGARRSRIALDDARAQSLKAVGLTLFLDTWYSGDLWTSLRAHPHFGRIISSRVQHTDIHALAKALSDLSVGRQPSLWEDLKQAEKPLMFLFGGKDKKFVEIGQQIRCELNHVSANGDDPSKEIHKVLEIPDSGHAIYIENPLLVVSAVRKFLIELKEQIP